MSEVPNLEFLIVEWKADCAIDKEQIGEASRRTPHLMAKYLEWYTRSKKVLRDHEKIIARVVSVLDDYYSGVLNNKADLEKLGREPWLLAKGTRETRQRRIEADQTHQEVQDKLAEASDRVEFLDKVLGQLGKRSYHLNNALEWEKYLNGMR